MADYVPFTVFEVPEYKGLDKDSADNYYRAAQGKAFLGSEIISPFEESLREFTGYSDDNIPDSEVEVPCELGKSRFVMRVTPTLKRPGYKEVFEEVDGHVTTRQAEYAAGERPVGILTIDEEPYISADEILAKIDKKKRQVMSKGVSISIDRPELEKASSLVVVPLGMDNGELSGTNAALYLHACRMAKDYGEFISAFEAEMLGLTGFDNGNPPGKTEHMYRQIGRHVFHVRSVPYESTSWGKVIDGLAARPKKADADKTGDLVLVTERVEHPRLKVYKARERDGDVFVRLKGLRKRIDGFVKENTETNVRQKPINHYPIV